MKEVIVIGGGPAGMMAAIAAKNENNNVTIIEKMKSLVKSYISLAREDVI